MNFTDLEKAVAEMREAIDRYESEKNGWTHQSKRQCASWKFKVSKRCRRI